MQTKLQGNKRDQQFLENRNGEMDGLQSGMWKFLEGERNVCYLDSGNSFTTLYNVKAEPVVQFKQVNFKIFQLYLN